mmetsp:Transcript_34640/g.53146  ORF Transcript_34640/g.53146 Transcript_34640/m.53146 type:complete len:272 (+) Transcript_34640:63-878(+)
MLLEFHGCIERSTGFALHAYAHATGISFFSFPKQPGCLAHVVFFVFASSTLEKEPSPLSLGFHDIVGFVVVIERTHGSGYETRLVFQPRYLNGPFFFFDNSLCDKGIGSRTSWFPNVSQIPSKGKKIGTSTRGQQEFDEIKIVHNFHRGFTVSKEPFTHAANSSWSHVGHVCFFYSNPFNISKCRWIGISIGSQQFFLGISQKLWILKGPTLWPLRSEFQLKIISVIWSFVETNELEIPRSVKFFKIFLWLSVVSMLHLNCARNNIGRKEN